MKFLILITLLSSGLVFAKAENQKSELESKLESLNIPSDKVTPVLSKEKLYAVNNRYSNLNKRHELTLFGANNFTSDAHMENTASGLAYRFHLNGRWSVGARYSEYFNKLSSAGEKLFENETQPILPDTDFAIKSSEGFINFNTVYGKIRFSKDTIVYFDQYISLGYGHVQLAQEETQLYTADLGFSFWLGKKMSSRIGVRNELYRQVRLKGNENVHNAMGYMEFGYLFGEGSRI